MDTIYNIFNNDDANHHSLHHGKKFNKRKINRNCNNSNKSWFNSRNGGKEGFEQPKSYNELRVEYSDVLAEYKSVLEEISASETAYNNRTNSSTGNIYLNKNVRFTNTDTNSIKSYTYAYVTNKGIVKKYGTEVMFNKTAGLNGCPDRNFTDVNIAWISAYDVAGATIQMPTIGSTIGPKLVVGAPMTQGQSCGYEGSNVFVDKMMDTISSRFIGCFDNSIQSSGYPLGNNYLGGQEPYMNYIQNGSFITSTVIGITDTDVTNDNILPWTTTNLVSGNVVLVNSDNTEVSGNLAYTKPYPNINSKRCVSLKNDGDLSQTIDNLTIGTYTLSFDACGFTTPNPINILLNDITVFTDISKYITPTLNVWTTYIVNIPITVASNKITFTGTTEGKMSAIQNIRLTNGTSNVYTNASTFSECETAAKTGSYNYFGFQNVDNLSTSGKGFCALSKNDGTSNLNVASNLMPVSLLEAGTIDTSTKGISATLTSYGVLLVNKTGGTTVPMSTNTILNTLTPCYLILGDDGTMKIYTFPSSTDSTPPDTPVAGNLLWNSGMPTKKILANSDYAAAKGKGSSAFVNGQNWMLSGTTLLPGEFIGSPSGNIYLIMGADGKLVLNTSGYASSCKVNATTGVMEGGLNSAALYKVNTATDNLFTYLGKLFFINEDSSLKTYPDTNKKLSSDYIKVANYNTQVDTDSLKYNLTGDYSSYNTLDSCKTACNGKPDCYGYSYTESNSNSSGVCNLKGSKITNDTGGPSVAGTDLYVRKETYKTKPLGISNTISSVFSTQKQNYAYDNSNANVSASYGVSTLVPDKRAQLSDLQNQLDDLQSQLDNYSGSNSNSNNSNSNNSNSNTGSNLNTIDDYLKEIQLNEKEISAIQSVKNSNLDNMLQDTDLVVLQENYKYLCWSILAATSVLIYVNVSNN